MKSAFFRHKFFFSIVLSFILFATPGPILWAFAQEPGAAGLMAFADSLFEERDYYRAISEYKRFIHYYPSDKRAETAFFRIAESYFKARRWQDAINAAKAFIKRYPQSQRVHDALMIKGSCEKKLKRYDDSALSFTEVWKTATGEIKQRAAYECALVYVEREDWDRANETFSKIPSDSILHGQASRFRSGLLKINDLPQKSPAVAGTLAAIIPGSGHVYTERYRDAIVAFVLNASFIIGAVELFRHDNNVAGGIVTFFEIGWYTGNIYSAVSSAHKFNRRAKEEYILKLKETIPISFKHDMATSTYCLMYSFSY